MKKILTLITMLLLTMSFTMATYDECSLTHLDLNCLPQVDVCSIEGFDYTIAVVPHNRGAYNYNQNSISLIGNLHHVDWTANSAIAGVLEFDKEATSYVHNGGITGGFDDTNKYIKAVAFCGNEDQDVPEFGVLAAIAVIGLAGLFIYKRRN